MKRAFDVVVSFLALLVFSPLMILVFFKVKKHLGSPAIFVQKRPGLNGKTFKMYKFRTMKDDVDADGNLLADEDRITPLGNKLRKSSLDELPELWNVLKGEMSIVGPRPLLTEYLPLYNKEQARRHDVRPGITGWAQVNGRNAISWNEKFKLDVWYVDNYSLRLDIKIIFLTIIRILARDGVEHKTAEENARFKGN